MARLAWNRHKETKTSRRMQVSLFFFRRNDDALELIERRPRKKKADEQPSKASRFPLAELALSCSRGRSESNARGGGVQDRFVLGLISRKIRKKKKKRNTKKRKKIEQWKEQRPVFFFLEFSEKFSLRSLFKRKKKQIEKKKRRTKPPF